MMSSSSLELMSSKAILMKAHNCATFTISVDSSNGRERHSRASINFLSCSSTAFPSHCLVEVFWESCTFAASRKASFTISPWLLVFSKDVTDVTVSNSCGVRAYPGSRFGEDRLLCCQLCCQSPNFCGTYRRFGKEIPLLALLQYAVLKCHSKFPFFVRATVVLQIKQTCFEWE